MTKKVLFRIRLITFALLLVAGGGLWADENAAGFDDKTVGCKAFPIIPMIIESKISTLHFRQYFTAADSLLTEINAFIGEGSEPLIQISVIEKDKREYFYSNRESRVKELNARNLEGFHTPIDFRKVEKDGQTLYGFGFRDREKREVLWRFVPATPLSDRAKGLISLSENSGLRLIDRVRGTLAGDGTIIRVGNQEFAAEQKTELGNSHGFPLFRGSISEKVLSGDIRTGEENWRVTGCPTEIKADEKWTLSNERGHRTLRIQSVAGDQVTVEETNELNQTNKRLIILRRTSNGLAIRSISCWHESAENFKISFMPELTLVSNDSVESSFQIDFGNRKNIASGAISPEKQGEKILLKLRFKSPDWAKSKKTVSEILIGSDGYKLKVS